MRAIGGVAAVARLRTRRDRGLRGRHRDRPRPAYVLDALAPPPAEWDLVKLIGRRREKTRSAAACCPGTRARPLPARAQPHRRPMSSPRAARRSCSPHRQPFGRPVDVDLRHWWECDLEVRGVWPYPVRGAATSAGSTIERSAPAAARRAARWASSGCRRVHVLNWSCARGGARRRWRRNARHASGRVTQSSGRPARCRRAGTSPARAGPTPSAQPRHPACRRRVAAPGVDSGRRRDFDMFVSYYGASARAPPRRRRRLRGRPGPEVAGARRAAARAPTRCSTPTTPSGFPTTTSPPTPQS